MPENESPIAALLPGRPCLALRASLPESPLRKPILDPGGSVFHNGHSAPLFFVTETTLLSTAAVKITLDEPRKKFLDMIACLKSYGTRQIHFIHIRTKSRYIYMEKAEAMLDEIVGEATAMGFEADFHIRTGHAPSLFADTAQATGADYLCLYWRPKGLLRQALLGSIDSDILRISNLPVFIHKPRLFGDTTQLDRVLYATDFKSTDAAAMPYLADSRFKARTLFLLNVRDRAPDPVTDKALRESVQESLRHLADQCRHAYDQVEIIQSIGMVRREITRQAKTVNADLLVVGRSEKPDAVARFIGSTAEILPHKTRCSVFIIPSICDLDAPTDEQDKECSPS